MGIRAPDESSFSLAFVQPAHPHVQNMQVSDQSIVYCLSWAGKSRHRITKESRVYKNPCGQPG